MNYKIFVILLLLTFQLLAQEKEKVLPVFLEHHSILTEDSQKEILTYRIPYDILLFTKLNDNYEAKFSLSVEFYDSTMFILREIKSSTVTTNDYELTERNSVYFQDMIKFDMIPGTYKLKVGLLIEGVTGQYDLPPYKINVENLMNKKISSPIFVEKTNSENDEISLVNFSNSLPLSPNTYEMLFCVYDSTISKLKYSIKNNNKVILEDSSNNYLSGTLDIVKNNNTFLIKENKENKAQKVFTISNFSNLLIEGKYEIEFSLNNEKYKFPILVVWINKPKVLNNPEYAIKLVSYIDDDEVVKDLLFRDEENYYEELFNYWNSKYPSKGTKYNYAMNEYYARADYAIENFSSLNSIDGAETDRGRIYITYGKPSSVERNYSEKNEIMEIWHYEKLGRDFIFKDTSGTGKFSLVH